MFLLDAISVHDDVDLVVYFIMVHKIKHMYCINQMRYALYFVYKYVSFEITLFNLTTNIHNIYFVLSQMYII